MTNTKSTADFTFGSSSYTAILTTIGIVIDLVSDTVSDTRGVDLMFGAVHRLDPWGIEAKALRALNHPLASQVPPRA